MVFEMLPVCVRVVAASTSSVPPPAWRGRGAGHGEVRGGVQRAAAEGEAAGGGAEIGVLGDFDHAFDEKGASFVEVEAGQHEAAATDFRQEAVAGDDSFVDELPVGIDGEGATARRGKKGAATRGETLEHVKGAACEVDDGGAAAEIGICETARMPWLRRVPVE